MGPRTVGGHTGGQLLPRHCRPVLQRERRSMSVGRPAQPSQRAAKPFSTGRSDKASVPPAAHQALSPATRTARQLPPAPSAPTGGQGWPMGAPPSLRQEGGCLVGGGVLGHLGREMDLPASGGGCGGALTLSLPVQPGVPPLHRKRHHVVSTKINKSPLNVMASKTISIVYGTTLCLPNSGAAWLGRAGSEPLTAPQAWPGTGMHFQHI